MVHLERYRIFDDSTIGGLFFFFYHCFSTTFFFFFSNVLAFCCFPGSSESKLELIQSSSSNADSPFTRMIDFYKFYVCVILLMLVFIFLCLIASKTILFKLYFLVFFEILMWKSKQNLRKKRASLVFFCLIFVLPNVFSIAQLLDISFSSS